MAWFVPEYKENVVYPTFFGLLPSVLISFLFVKLRTKLKEKFDYIRLKQLTNTIDENQNENSVKISVPEKVKKFSDLSTEFTLNLIVYLTGFILIRHKPWFDDFTSLIKIFPHQTLEMEQIIFYNMYLGYCFSQLISLRDQKVKVIYIIHHTVTPITIIIAWMINGCCIGCMMAYSYKLTDLILSALRVLDNLRYFKVCLVGFIIYCLLWFHIRVIWTFNMLWELYWRHLPPLHERAKIHYLVCVLQNSIFIIQLYWTVQLMQIIEKTIRNRELKDER